MKTKKKKTNSVANQPSTAEELGSWFGLIIALDSMCNLKESNVTISFHDGKLKGWMFYVEHKNLPEDRYIAAKMSGKSIDFKWEEVNVRTSNAKDLVEKVMKIVK